MRIFRKYEASVKEIFPENPPVQEELKSCETPCEEATIVYDDFTAKTQAWMSAFRLVSLIVSIDHEIINTRDSESHEYKNLYLWLKTFSGIAF